MLLVHTIASDLGMTVFFKLRLHPNPMYIPGQVPFAHIINVPDMFGLPAYTIAIGQFSTLELGWGSFCSKCTRSWRGWGWKYCPSGRRHDDRSGWCGGWTQFGTTGKSGVREYDTTKVAFEKPASNGQAPAGHRVDVERKLFQSKFGPWRSP